MDAFAIGLIIGLVLFPLVEYLTSIARPRKKIVAPVIQPQVKEIKKELGLRDHYIDLTHYTWDQLREVYDLLRGLQEPISEVYEEHKDWWEEGYDPYMYKKSYSFDYLGFGKSSWVVLTKWEIRDLKQIELRELLDLIRVEYKKRNK